MTVLHVGTTVVKTDDLGPRGLWFESHCIPYENRTRAYKEFGKEKSDYFLFFDKSVSDLDRASKSDGHT